MDLNELENSASSLQDEGKRRQSTSRKNNNDLPCSPLSLEDQLLKAKEQIAKEKAGKRKLFHSLVKIAEELSKTRQQKQDNQDQPSSGFYGTNQQYGDRGWYSGGIWRAPNLLPSVTSQQQAGGGSPKSKPPSHTKTARLRESISLSDLFFNLVIVTAFTRVGVAMSQQGGIAFSTICYFFIVWTVWGKQASYSTRFDTSDLSAQMTTLITCFAVLFLSLSVQAPINTTDANRIMIMAAAVAAIHCGLYFRVLLTVVAYRRQDSQPVPEEIQPLTSPMSTTNTAATTPTEDNLEVLEQQLRRQIFNHAVLHMATTSVEAAVWLFGYFFTSVDGEYRWLIFVLALLVAEFRVPRAFLTNDFHAACSNNGVLFILLLGFLLQSVVVVASEFFTYETPNWEQYAFLGAVCVLFFCIKLLYVDDEADTLAQDHAMMVNRWAAFFFHFGQFFLLLSVTVLGSGLNLLTHSYLAATAALPGPEKQLVCGGFSAALLSTFFIKSMHIKRIPVEGRNRALFVAAYVIETVVLLGVAVLSGFLSVGRLRSGWLQYILLNDLPLIFFLSGAAVFVVMMSWLDEGIELALYESAEDSRAYRVHPFGFWFCCGGTARTAAEQVTEEEEEAIIAHETALKRRSKSMSGNSLSAMLSPLLTHSVARELRNYDAIPSQFRNSLVSPGSAGSLNV